ARGEWIEDLHGHVNASFSIAFSKNGRRLISTSGGREMVAKRIDDAAFARQRTSLPLRKRRRRCALPAHSKTWRTRPRPRLSRSVLDAVVLYRCSALSVMTLRTTVSRCRSHACFQNASGLAHSKTW